MSSYVLIDTATLDEQAYSEFAVKIREAVMAAGGSFLVRGGDVEVIEGDWSPQRIVILAFDSAEGAGSFVRSDSYTGLKQLREQAVKSNVVVVSGYDG